MLLMVSPPFHVPPMPCRHAADVGRRFKRVRRRRARQPIQERLPHLSRLLRIQSNENHANFKRVVRRDVYLLAPMIVEERFAVKADELPNQTLKLAIGRSLDLEFGTSGKFR